MQLRREHVEHANRSVARRAACLLHDEAEGIRLVEQAQLAVLALGEVFDVVAQALLEGGHRVARLGGEERRAQLVEERAELAEPFAQHRERKPVHG